MSFGSNVINELARRRELGMYFDYAGYRTLRNIQNATEAVAFLRHRGYPNAPEFNDPVETRGRGYVIEWRATELW